MSVLFHLVAYVSSSLITHDTVLAIKMILDGNPLPKFVRRFRPAFDNDSDSFVTGNEWQRSNSSRNVVPFPQVDVGTADGNCRDFYLTLILVQYTFIIDFRAKLTSSRLFNCAVFIKLKAFNRISFDQSSHFYCKNGWKLMTPVASP